MYLISLKHIKIYLFIQLFSFHPIQNFKPSPPYFSFHSIQNFQPSEKNGTKSNFWEEPPDFVTEKAPSNFAEEGEVQLIVVLSDSDKDDIDVRFHTIQDRKTFSPLMCPVADHTRTCTSKLNAPLTSPTRRKRKTTFATARIAAK